MSIQGDQAHHVFGETPTDGRQNATPDFVPSRFRPQYRNLSLQEKQLHDSIKAAAEGLEHLYGQIAALRLERTSRYGSLALTALEESVMWAIKDLTS